MDTTVFHNLLGIKKLKKVELNSHWSMVKCGGLKCKNRPIVAFSNETRVEY